MPSLSKEAALVHEALVARGLETPLRPPVHEMDNETRKSLIAGHMTEIMQLLNLDLADDSLMETPHRIAKMYVDEIFSGLDYANFPKITLIENKMKVDEMVTVRVVLFDRSGHRTKFTNVGRMLLERGRVLLEAADKLTTDAEALARGWETHLTIVTEALVPTPAFFPLIDKLAAKANTQLAIITEVLAGAWERLEQGRADIVIAPDMHFRSSSEINSRKLYTLMNVYVAAPDHPIHQEPEPLSEVTRVKYRGIAVADTARERPVLTVQLLDKQPRLTVSTIEDKRQALLAGLGVATMPYPMVEKDIAEGRLRVVSPESTSEIDIIMAWRRDSMGEAKSWCLREIPKLFSGK